VIHGGGAANVVAGHAFAELDVRFWENAECDRISRSLEQLCANGFLNGVTTSLKQVNHKPAMAASEATAS
jgi:Peptidase dimerisation domain.